MRLKFGICSECLIKAVCRTICNNKTIELRESVKKKFNIEREDYIPMEEIVKELSLETGVKYQIIHTTRTLVPSSDEVYDIEICEDE